jgi:pyruvate dehydrogenase E2 component (dihydrolipoamide acetyltransferase)
MSVSVSMPQLGESVTEGTVTRWLKQEGERVEADEPLLEVSTDKVDTEIPSPVSGILRGITVAEDETVAVGAELAIIDEEGSGGGAEAQPAQAEPTATQPAAAQPAPQEQPAAGGDAQPGGGPAGDGAQEYGAGAYQQPYAQQPAQQVPAYEAPSPYTAQPQEPPGREAPQSPSFPPAQQQPTQQYPVMPPGGEQPTQQVPAAQAPSPPAPAPQAPAPQIPQQAAQPQPAPQQAAQQPQAGPPVAAPAEQPAPAEAPPEADGVGPDLESGAEGPYVTPLVRKLAAEHGIDLGNVAGTGVGGRIRKQDVLDAARALRDSGAAPEQAAPQQAAPQQQAPPQPAAAPPAAAPPAQAPPAQAPPAQAPSAPQAPAAGAGAAPGAPARPEIVPSGLRGRTEKLSRSRQVIAQRMVESLQTSAQLTTVVEADVTAIARLRDRAKAAFEAREGVKLSFLPFFALATVEALKVHPSLNAIIDTASNQVTYHDAEHLGIAVDTERGLIVPVIHEAGDLNIGGLARKIADLAERTRAGRISPDELSGGTFTLTNTGSRGALFDTPIINQPQVGILGTGTVVKRAVVVEDPHLGEVITVRSMVYLSLTYDHRLVDGADAARFLGTMKARLEEGAFEAELGL